MVTKQKVIVIGGGGHAKVIISILKKIKRFNTIGYLDTADKGRILGVKYLGDDKRLGEIKNRYGRCAAVIGIGTVAISDKRHKIKEKLESLGYALPAVVSPDAVVNEDVEIGEGAVIHDGAVINSGSCIGVCAIINTGSSVDHDCWIGDFVHIAPGAVLCGGVRVGDNSLIGAGATVIPYKKICRDSLIGAGAVVINDCDAPGVYMGIPAKKR